jgi:hypothetical protein
LHIGLRRGIMTGMVGWHKRRLSVTPFLSVNTRLTKKAAPDGWARSFSMSSARCGRRRHLSITIIIAE